MILIMKTNMKNYIICKRYTDALKPFVMNNGRMFSFTNEDKAKKQLEKLKKRFEIKKLKEGETKKDNFELIIVPVELNINSKEVPMRLLSKGFRSVGSRRIYCCPNCGSKEVVLEPFKTITFNGMPSHCSVCGQRLDKPDVDELAELTGKVKSTSEWASILLCR